MIVVVDTNIVFSGILNPNGKISDILLNSHDVFQFFAPTLILEELHTHHKKLVKFSGLTENEITFLKGMLLKKVGLIDLENISSEVWELSLNLVKDIDYFDAPFIALSMELDSIFWTGDKKLINGLKKKNINWILDTDEILNIRDKA